MLLKAILPVALERGSWVALACIPRGAVSGAAVPRMTGIDGITPMDGVASAQSCGLDP